MNSHTEFEIKNYGLSLLRNPGLSLNLLRVVRRYGGRLFKRALGINGRNGIFNIRQPSYLNPDLRSGYDVRARRHEKDNISIEKETRSSALKSGRILSLNRIILATQEYKIDKLIDWEAGFDDEEDYEALHRFYWLLIELSTQGKSKFLIEWALDQIHDWIDLYIANIDNSAKWNTYTTSERIANWILFMKLCGVEISSDQKVSNAVQIMAGHVRAHIEYYGEQETFNHIINDARALYLYGQGFNNQDYVSDTRKIFSHELPRLVTADGFLREGSSHYHFLFTRWLLEILYIAQSAGDRITAQIIEPFAIQSVEKCYFFLIFDDQEGRWSMPLVGDVSPDCSPEWLLKLPWSSIATLLVDPPPYGKQPVLDGWAKLFEMGGVERKTEKKQVLNQQKEEGVAWNRASGWCRINFGDLTFFFYIRPEYTFGCEGHYHNDSSAFCLYKKGKPLLIDIGRMSYQNNALGNYGTSGRAHNSVLIDGIEVHPFCRSAYLKELYDPGVFRAGLTKSVFDGVLRVTLTHEGFRRLWKEEVNHVRTFEVNWSERTCEIRDSFEGSKVHPVEIIFHFAPALGARLDAHKKKIYLGEGTDRCEMEYDISGNDKIDVYYGDDNGLFGWHFPKYGEKVPIYTIVYRANNTFPFERRFKLTWL